LNKTLIAIFSIVVLPLGLVVGVSAADPSPTHSVSYKVLSDRSISVEPIEDGESTAVDFGTIARTGTFTKTDVRLRFSAEDATGSPSVNIQAAIATGNVSFGQTLSVTAGTVSDEDVTATSATASLAGTAKNVLTGASKASGGIMNVTSDLTYTLVHDNVMAGNFGTVTVTYTLIDTPS
jgi:hypothetical protein